MGNEEGSAGETCWSTFSPELHEAQRDKLPGDYRKYLTEGDENGSMWLPAETDVSIRPGWFWKETENDKVKSLQHLLKIYYESVGRNSLLLLNVPPDTRGRIHETDSVRLMELRAALDQIFAVNLADGKIRRSGDSWTIAAKGPFNRVVLQEEIAKGQRISAFTVEASTQDGWKEIGRGTTVGYKRIHLVDECEADAVRVTVDKSLAKPLLKSISLYEDTIYKQ